MKCPSCGELMTDNVFRLHTTTKCLRNQLAQRDELLHHTWIHSGYRNCGFDQMTTEQKTLFQILLNEKSVSDE